MRSGFLLLYGFLLCCWATQSYATDPVDYLDEQSDSWQRTLNTAKGQSVYFYAWGGSPPINDYLRWASREIAKQYRVKLVHVKVADIAEAISRLKAENGRSSAIDLMWVNGENFSYLKQQNMLLGDLWSTIPNSRLLAIEYLPITSDFGEPMNGLEVPWGIGQFNIMGHDQVFESDTLTAATFLEMAKSNKQSLTYPKPPEFHGVTFLKQLLVSLTQSDQRLYVAADQAAQHALLPVLWTYLDKLHPHLWRQGQAFPSTAPEQLLMFQQNTLKMAVSFNPNERMKEAHSGRIAASTTRHYFGDGAITNSHNLAIPKFSANPDAARVVIHFMLSKPAQQQKLQGSWGDPSVIIPLLKADSTLPAHQELHSSWQLIIEQAWHQRYGA